MTETVRDSQAALGGGPSGEHPPLRFGMNLTATHEATSPPSVQLAEHQEGIGLARDIGFDLIIAGQHYASPDLRYFQPVPYLAHIADVAEGMRLALGIIVLPLHHPLTVAEDVATLDAVTGGRVTLGVAIGYSQREFDAFGIDRTTRTARFEESLGIVRQLMDGRTVTHKGQFFDLDEVASSTLPATRVPIWIGAQAEVSVKRAARLADAWYVPPFPTQRELIGLSELYESERTRQGMGPADELPVRREVFIADSKAEARQALEMAQERYAIYSKWGLELEATSNRDHWLDSRFIVGDPHLVAERLHNLREHVPMTHLVYKPQWVGLDHREAMQQLERFGADVVPLLVDETGVRAPSTASDLSS